MKTIQIQKSISDKLNSGRDFSDMIGLLPNTGDSVKEVREIRRRDSEKLKGLDLNDPKVVKKLVDELNKLIE